MLQDPQNGSIMYYPASRYDLPRTWGDHRSRLLSRARSLQQPKARAAAALVSLATQMSDRALRSASRVASDFQAAKARPNTPLMILLMLSAKAAFLNTRKVALSRQPENAWAC